MNLETHRGRESLRSGCQSLAASGVRTVLVVSGGRSFAACGAEAMLAEALAGFSVVTYGGVLPNPTVELVEGGLTVWEEAQPDAIVAVGGGSVIDVAKLLKAFAGNGGRVRANLLGGAAVDPVDIPLVAIPTTAGSGSEATHFAVVYSGDEKFSVAHPRLLPTRALLVPELLRGLPGLTMAASGADALCQAIESYWSIHSTDGSRQVAAGAIGMVVGSLERAVSSRAASDLRLLMEGAHQAGKAINLTKTTAPHAVSYALTTQFGVAHGEAVSMVLPAIYSFNRGVSEADSLDPRGAAFVRARLGEISVALGCGSPESAEEMLAKLFARCGLRRHLAEIGVTDSGGIEQIVRHGFNPERVNNNPRRLTEEALREILTTII